VVLSGKQKAALLLMGLDAATAAELLKGVDPQTVQELAVEVAYLMHPDSAASVKPRRLPVNFIYRWKTAADWMFRIFWQRC